MNSERRVIVCMVAMIACVVSLVPAHARPPAPGPTGGTSFGPSGAMAPAGWEFGAVRLGKARTVSFIARGKTCGEIEPAKPDCAGLVTTDQLIGAQLRATGDFEIVKPEGGCSFPVATLDGSPCPFRVRFEPRKPGKRTGAVLSNGYGRIALTGTGAEKKPPKPPKPGPGLPQTRG